MQIFKLTIPKGLTYLPPLIDVMSLSKEQLYSHPNATHIPCGTWLIISKLFSTEHNQDSLLIQEDLHEAVCCLENRCYFVLVAPSEVTKVSYYEIPSGDLDKLYACASHYIQQLPFASSNKQSLF